MLIRAFHTLRDDRVLLTRGVRMICAAALGAMLAPAASVSAQSADWGAGPVVFSDGWQVMESRCKLAVEDPSAYLASVPPQGPFGVPAFSQSPDGQVVWAREWTGAWTAEVIIAAAGAIRVISCDVHAFDESAGFDDPASEGARKAAELTAHFAQRPDLPLTGGQMTLHYPEVMDGQGSVIRDESLHHFASSVAWGGETLPVWLEAAGGAFSMHVMKTERAAQ